MTYPLGKLPPRVDPRTLRLSSVLRAVAVPSTWDADGRTALAGPMYRNDTIGDCVIAGRAHQQARFERREHPARPDVWPSEAEVLAEYWRETGGVGIDTGLVVLDSLSQWRRVGWTAAGQRETIRAYASVDPTSNYGVRAAMSAKLGVGIGLALPLTAEAQLDAGRPWTVVGGGRGWSARPGTWGLHYTYAVAYSPACLQVVTWGRRVKVSWAFLARYCDEAWAIIDTLDGRGDVLDVAAVEAYLAERKPVEVQDGR